MKNVSLVTVGPNNGRRTYNSINAVSRVLTGNGTTNLKSTISRVSKKGAYIGNVYVVRADRH